MSFSLSDDEFEYIIRTSKPKKSLKKVKSMKVSASAGETQLSKVRRRLKNKDQNLENRVERMEHEMHHKFRLLEKKYTLKLCQLSSRLKESQRMNAKAIDLLAAMVSSNELQTKKKFESLSTKLRENNKITLEAVSGTITNTRTLDSFAETLKKHQSYCVGRKADLDTLMGLQAKVIEIEKDISIPSKRLEVRKEKRDQIEKENFLHLGLGNSDMLQELTRLERRISSLESHGNHTNAGIAPSTPTSIFETSMRNEKDELQEQRAKDVVMLKRELSQFNGKFLKVEAAVRSVEEAVGFFYRNSNWDVKSNMKADELMNFGKLNVETPGKYNESLARDVKAHLNSLGIGSPR